MTEDQLPLSNKVNRALWRSCTTTESRDLISMNFYVWSTLKSKVIVELVYSSEDLQLLIIDYSYSALKENVREIHKKTESNKAD